jgi:hypothetical protein
VPIQRTQLTHLRQQKDEYQMRPLLVTVIAMMIASMVSLLGFVPAVPLLPFSFELLRLISVVPVSFHVTLGLSAIAVVLLAWLLSLFAVFECPLCCCIVLCSAVCRSIVTVANIDQGSTMAFVSDRQRKVCCALP